MTFPAITVGLSIFLCINYALYMRTRDQVYLQIYRSHRPPRAWRPGPFLWADAPADDRQGAPGPARRTASRQADRRPRRPRRPRGNRASSRAAPIRSTDDAG